MHRRDALRALAASAGLHWLERLDVAQIIELGERLHVHARLGRTQSASVLGERLRETVTTAAERIIPASDTPGATDANVTTFVDRMLADWYDTADRDRVLAGLGDLDVRSRAGYGSNFTSLGETDQIAILETVDSEAAAVRLAARAPGGNAREHWFSTFKFLVVWGYCTSEVGMRETLGAWPLPGRYESCAPYQPSVGAVEP